MADLGADADDFIRRFVEDPNSTIPEIIEIIESMVNGELEVSEDYDPANDPMGNFLQEHNPLGLSIEQIQSMIEGIATIGELDDGNISVKEVVGTIIIGGGIVPEDTLVSAQGMNFVSSFLEQLGMSEQIDTFGATLAYYFDHAHEDAKAILEADENAPANPQQERGFDGLGRGIQLPGQKA